jgi:3-ketosteroid 9alpha-monooxygenase subunit A
MAKTADYGLGEFTFPRGWFMVAAADEVTDKPLAVRFFGQDFALYRGKSGKAILLDAYCPHMGTHLTKNSSSYVVQDGQIEGDSIRCPYHAWRFGPDGKCDHIPYYDGPIPKAAQVRSWPIVERMGCLWVWHDAEGGAPDYEVPLLDAWDDPSWVRGKVDHLGQMATHPQEIVENMCDLPHLGPVHGSPSAFFENEIRGHVIMQRQGGHPRHRPGNGLFTTDTWYTGPGFLISHQQGPDRHVYELIMHTPVDDGVTQVWHNGLFKTTSAVATEADVAKAREDQAFMLAGFVQDFDVWANKAPCINVLQLPTDGPFNKGRLWYKQFYNPRARAAEILKDAEGVHRVRGFPSAPPKAAE